MGEGDGVHATVGLELEEQAVRAALGQLGHTEIRAEIRPDGETEASERAAENIVRSSLNPYEPGTIASDATLGASRDR